MNTLLVYPEYPETFWSYKHALKFISAKAAFPPLGLLTVASMLPPEWRLRLVDLNVRPLTPEDLMWADIVFLSAMTAQYPSAEKIIAEVKLYGKKIVAGGPHFFHFHGQINGVDHFILGEAEEVLPLFLTDLSLGQAKMVYQAKGYPDLSLTPSPRWDLINFADYTSMPVQLSRGCPFDCEFCDVIVLFGRRPRYKSASQFINELESLRRAGWHGNVMIVDDNFIGDKGKANEILETLLEWQIQQGFPFFFVTQASVNLAEETQLLSLMAKNDFRQIFLGIETPNLSSLAECHKHQNQKHDMLAAVKTIQQYGLEVMGGFIVGFDSDSVDIFEAQISFIEQAAIPVAMVGLLTAAPRTKLWFRLEKAGRIIGSPTGDNAMDLAALNFQPQMGKERLISGYKEVLRRLYTPKSFFDRTIAFFKQYRPKPTPRRRLPQLREIAAFFRIIWQLGLRDQDRREFRRFLYRVIVGRYDLGMAINFAASGHHYWVITQAVINSG